MLCFAGSRGKASWRGSAVDRADESSNKKGDSQTREGQPSQESAGSWTFIRSQKMSDIGGLRMARLKNTGKKGSYIVDTPSDTPNEEHPLKVLRKVGFESNIKA